MSKDCASRKHPLSRNGAAQPERLPTALPPGQAPVDGRRLEELLAFAYRYAGLVRYYNTANEPDGDWRRFFEMDDTSLLAVISQLGDDFLDEPGAPSGLGPVVEGWAARLSPGNPFRAELEAILEDIAGATTGPDYRKAFLKMKARAALFLPQMLERNNHKPHIALFLTFLKLYKHLQEHLNTLPGRHLDFFLESVLRLRRKPQEPDAVHLLFELAGNRQEQLLPAGTLLPAGKDSLGRKLMYALKGDLVVNRAKVERIHSLFIDRQAGGRVYAAPAANSADGQGTEFGKGEEAHWAPFGNAEQPQAALGFAIASPILYLQEGKREITLTLELAGIQGAGLSQAFEFFLSGEEGWLPLALKAETINDIDGPEFSGAEFIYTLELPESAPAVVGYDSAALAGGFQTSFPILKALLARPEAYGQLSGAGLANATIEVDCTGLSSLILQNDYARFEVGKAFQPFGPRPRAGANFYIGSAEAFQKELQYLGVTIEWDGLPDDFADHYKAYSAGIGNDSFKVNTYGLNGRAWQKIGGQKNLFQVVGSTDLKLEGETQVLTENYVDSLIAGKQAPAGAEMRSQVRRASIQGIFRRLPFPVVSKTRLSGASLLAYKQGAGLSLPFSRKGDISGLEPYSPSADDGFLRLQLGSQDFLHDAYSKVYTQAIIANTDDDATNDKLLPNEPYTPAIRQLLLDYSSSEQIIAEGRQQGPGQFFHLYPFGQAPAGQENPGLLPAFMVDNTPLGGALYLGFSGLQPKQTVSLLFQVLEGSGEPEAAAPAVRWAYLNRNQWKPIAPLSDSTLGLLQSGIARLPIPSDMTTDNTILGGGSWIRLSVAASGDTRAFPRLLGIHAQAGLAVFQDKRNAPDHLASALPAGTIARLAVRDPAIAGLSQPYASFGGRLPEDDTLFYRRASEQLRHKGKAITIWDYERLVLEAFPSIYKVKCVSHHHAKNAVAPGHVLIGLIPDLANRNARNPFEPKAPVGILAQVEQFLQRRVTPFIRCNLHVVNPTYEQVKVYFGVRFRKGYEDSGYYAEVLQEAIRRYLAPWAYQSTAKIAFGGKMNVSNIIHFIEQLPYVDYIKDFKADHYAGGELEKTNVMEIETLGPVSVLTSADRHDIFVIKATEQETLDCPQKKC